MKRPPPFLLLSISSFFYSAEVYTQSWCPPGATWYYSGHDHGGYIKTSYRTDTLIGDITAHIIDRMDVLPVTGSIPDTVFQHTWSITTSSGDTVLILHNGV